MRAIAGLWNSGKGTITFYAKQKRELLLSSDIVSCDVISTNEIMDTPGLREKNRGGVFFLPQRPYMVLGTLRQQLLYPTWTEDLDFMVNLTEETGMSL